MIVSDSVLPHDSSSALPCAVFNWSVATTRVTIPDFIQVPRQIEIHILDAPQLLADLL